MGNRIYYAVQQIGIGAANGDSLVPVHGVQSAGINTSFITEPIPSLGDLPIYTVLENSYEIQINLKKVLDGYSLLYLLATSEVSDSRLQKKAMARCSFGLSIFDDSLTYAVGTPLAVLQSTGLYLSSLKYNFPDKGNFEEEIGLIGNHRAWGVSFDGQFDGLDAPISAGGGINQRQDMYSKTLPTEIPSDAHVNNISFFTTINRENIPQLGDKTSFFKLPTFPIETTTEITVTPTGGDNIVTPTGSCSGFIRNMPQTIAVSVCDGTSISMGTGNILVSVNYQGGDAGGGNVKTSYTYKGYNDFTVTHLAH